jgi:hypothetical protein
MRIFTITLRTQRFFPEARRYSNGPMIATSRAATLVAGHDLQIAEVMRK